SRAAKPGSLFLACRGQKHHGIDFAGSAIALGAGAVLYEPADDAVGSVEQTATHVAAKAPNVFFGSVPQLSRHVGTIADRFFGAPYQVLDIAGITGTNGKTTCAYLLSQALTHTGAPTGYIGTIGYGLPSALTATSHTTSDAVTVHRQLAQLR